MPYQRGGFNSSYMTNGWMLRVRDLKVSCNVSNLLTRHFHPNRIRHMIFLHVDNHSLWASGKSTNWMQVFEKGMLRNTFRSVREQAADQDIWRFLRTGCWEIYLELFENGLLRRTFRSVRQQAADQDIWRYLRIGCWAGQGRAGVAEENYRRCSRTACWGDHLEVFENRLLSKIFCPQNLLPSCNILPVNLMIIERGKQNSWDKEEMHINI